MSRDRALQLLAQAEYGVLSMCDIDGTPYGIPVNYVWDGANVVYIHCAPAGRKLQCIDHNGRVSLCVVGNTQLMPTLFTTQYESIVVTADAVRHLSDDERQRAVELLLDKLAPNDKQRGLKAAQASMHRLEVIRLDITSCTGKCKHVPSSHQ